MKPIAFCHIPKTGGTSVHQVLARWVGPGAITDQIKSDNYSNAMRAWGHFSVVSGHFWFKPGERLDHRRLNVTLLRHPVDRVLSHYYYVRSQDPTFHASAPERALDLEAYISSGLPSIRTVRENFQSRLLAPLGIDSEAPELTDSELLGAAIKALDSFDLVGIFPELSDTADMVAYLAQCATDGELPHERATEGRPRIADVSQDVLRELERQNALDLELYEHALGVFKRKRRGLFLASINALAAQENSSAKTEIVAISAPQKSRSNGGGPDIADYTQPGSRFGNRAIEVVSTAVYGDVSLQSGAVMVSENVTICVRVAAHVSEHDLTIGIHIRDSSGRMVFGTNSYLLGRRISVSANSEFWVFFRFKNTLGPGNYRVGFSLHTGVSHLTSCYDWLDDGVMLNVAGIIGYHFEGCSFLALGEELRTIRGQAPVISDIPASSHVVRLTRHNPTVNQAQGRLRALNEISMMRLGDVVSIEIELENQCDQTLECDGIRPVRVCYRWLNSDTREFIQEEGIRTNMGVDIPRGSVHRGWISVTSPPKFVGDAILRIVLVQENVAWFDRLGNFYLDMPVAIHTQSDPSLAVLDRNASMNMRSSL